MSFGLSRILKNLLPKRLFYRGLLIVAVPILILQITISLVFFDSLWIKTNKGLTKALVSEIVTISLTRALVKPLFVLIHKLSKKARDIVICNITIGTATINNPL